MSQKARDSISDQVKADMLMEIKETIEKNE